MNKIMKSFLIFTLLNIVTFNVTAQVVDSTLVRPKITLLNGTYILEWNSDADKKVGLGIQTPLDKRPFWSSGSVVGTIIQVEEDCKCKLSDEDKEQILNFYISNHSSDTSERIYNGWYEFK